jgi:hypothetical protein
MVWLEDLRVGAVVHLISHFRRFLMNQEALLLPLLKFEKHVVPSNVEADFFSSDIDPCLGVPQEWSPKNEMHSKVAFYVETTKSARMKEFLTRTRRFLTIPSGYRIVELVSCTHMKV